MAYHYIIRCVLKSIMSKSTIVFLIVFALFWEASNGWRWKTTDAVIQDVWPEESVSKLKRASPRRSIDNSGAPRNKLPYDTKDDASLPTNKVIMEMEDDLVFDGHYFKPNEVSLPPPPPFMVTSSNWEGSGEPTPTLSNSPETEGQKLQTLYKQQMPSSYFVVGVGDFVSPPSPLLHTVKFTEENVRMSPITGNNKTATEEEKIHSSSNSNPKTIPVSGHSSSDFPSLEEIQYFEEQDFELLKIFKDAPKCYTTTDTQGSCIKFKQCFPVVFNVIDGELRNPGLAKLLYQASGPCNATLEFEFALRKLDDEKTFLQANFYNQTVCCPGFKFPPESFLEGLPNEVRNARLIPSAKTETSKIAASASNTSNNSGINESLSRLSVVDTGSKSKEKLEVEYTSRLPLSVEESSVEHEAEIVEFTTNVPYQNQEEVAEEDADGGEIFEEVALNFGGNENNTDNENKTYVEFEEFYKEERRENADSKEKKGFLKVSDAFSAVPAPNLSPGSCRQQLYGMPRGHWPWMVALVISSRHICSGALVDEKHVLTASHCVFLLNDAEVRKLRVIIGDRVMYSSVDGPHFWRKVAKIITHVNYNQQTFASDLAILRLNSPVPFSRNIQPISLPELSSIDTSLIYRKGIVAGWSGADIGQPAFEARTEVETVVEIMDKIECREIYRGFASTGLASNTFCTKPANNTCVADSGAPLIVRSQNCWLLQGIMSFGIGCSHFPEVYTDVSRYTSWIRRHLS